VIIVNYITLSFNLSRIEIKRLAIIQKNKTRCENGDNGKMDFISN
jgi:hypothetical protein